MSRYAYEAEPDNVVSFQNGATVHRWRTDRAGRLELLQDVSPHTTSNRVVIDACGVPVFAVGVNYGDDVDGARMTAVLRSKWPTVRAVFVSARGSWQGSDLAYFDVIADSAERS